MTQPEIITKHAILALKGRFTIDRASRFHATGELQIQAFRFVVEAGGAIPLAFFLRELLGAGLPSSQARDRVLVTA